MKRDPLFAKVLATRLIANVSPDLAKELKLRPDQKSLALITADIDDDGWAKACRHFGLID